ncbi:zinc ribbon domain-containing protein [Clostridium arbusti]|uniref:zinc ribbon domain-containing protein n=1 Tax=Clostridium arbusti TaxID=1137848 RepID=UPI000288617B|nr:zinc ribbon domain-containing protein [Clostridium arbusti]
MVYCYKCGYKLEDEDLFCPNCGAKKATLSDITKENSTKSERNNFNLDKVVNLKSVLDILLNMFLRPVSTAEKFINETEKNIALIITVFVLIIQGLLGMWRISQIISSINSITMNLANRIAGLASLIQPGSSSDPISSSELNTFTSEIDKFRPYVKIPYGKIFIQNCALILIGILIVFIILCLANSMLSKNKGDIFKFYKTALIITIPTLYFELFSILLSYLSINFGLVVALLGFIISLVCLSIVIKESLPLPENVRVFVVSVAAIFTVIVLAICLKSFIYSDIATLVSSIMNAIKNLNL